MQAHGEEQGFYVDSYIEALEKLQEPGFFFYRESQAIAKSWHEISQRGEMNI